MYRTKGTLKHIKVILQANFTIYLQQLVIEHQRWALEIRPNFKNKILLNLLAIESYQTLRKVSQKDQNLQPLGLIEKYFERY